MDAGALEEAIAGCEWAAADHRRVGLSVVVMQVCGRKRDGVPRPRSPPNPGGGEGVMERAVKFPAETVEHREPRLIPDNCRAALLFYVEDAERTGDRLGYGTREPYLRDGLGIDPELADWAREVLRIFEKTRSTTAR